MRRVITFAALHIILYFALNMQDTVRSCLYGVLGPSLYTVYPLLDDSSLISSRYPSLYPLLVVNGIPVRDSIVVNLFRNHYDRDMVLCCNKLYTQQQGIALGYNDCPLDGILIMKSRKKAVILPILNMSSTEANYLNKEYGVMRDEFDFTGKNVCLVISKSRRVIESMIRDTICECHFNNQTDKAQLIILNGDQRDASGYDAIIWYTSR